MPARSIHAATSIPAKSIPESACKNGRRWSKASSSARRLLVGLGADGVIVLDEVGIHALQSFAQRYRRMPAQRVDAGDVEELARRAIGQRRVKLDLAAEADDLGDQASELGNRDVFAGADIKEFKVRIAFHDEHAGVG